ncbi:unnamed protein product [Calypogeia fissa]
MATLRLSAVFAVAAILHMLVGLAWGKFVVEENSIKITAPDELKGTYDSAIGNFGIPQYGATMAGSVVYSADGAKACDEFKSPQDWKDQAGGWGRPVVVLVDRGDCFFAKKVYNAQMAGAAAVLVADDRDEELITMDSPDEGQDNVAYVDNITIPSALIKEDLGVKMKNYLKTGAGALNIKLDWSESLPHPDERVEYEFWTNSNDECGPKCDAQVDFVKNFRGAAQILERGKYTQFTPHYITWYCPPPFIRSSQCQSQCINHGRYCAPDPEQDFGRGYNGKDVVTENLRQLCVYKVTNDVQKPWTWWDYVTDFQIRCPMKENKYSDACAEEVISSLGLSVADVKKCMGDPNADADNPILKGEQDAQVGHGARGDVTILPTLMINERQYRGKLDKAAVLKAICAGFKETTDPPPCLSEEVETNECLDNNGGCWQNEKANVTACLDTFRGRVCQCPVVQGVQFQGDGYKSCEPTGPGRCKIDNGGCWQETQSDVTFSACSDSLLTGCKCPEGFRGDGVNGCVDINECSEKLACQCAECTCKNNWGGYDCQCQGDLLYIKEHETCISKLSSASKVGWWISLVVIAGVVAIGVGGYIVYKYRIQSYMDSEIRAIMAQYMPLDNQAEMSHEHNTVP